MISYIDIDGKTHTLKYEKDTNTIDLSNQGIMEIVKIEGLENLLVLNLSSNKIAEIKCLDSLINLRTLWLYLNEIKEIKGLEKLTKLQKLSLDSNQITEIKGLDTNQISEIKGLARLINLESLSLHTNKITKIQGLNTLAKLQKVWLQKNQIKFVPLSIINHKKLQLLWIDCKLDQSIKRFIQKNRPIKTSWR